MAKKETFREFGHTKQIMPQQKESRLNTFEVRKWAQIMLSFAISNTFSLLTFLETQESLFLLHGHCDGKVCPTGCVHSFAATHTSCSSTVSALLYTELLTTKGIYWWEIDLGTVLFYVMTNSCDLWRVRRALPWWDSSGELCAGSYTKHNSHAFLFNRIYICLSTHKPINQGEEEYGIGSLC